MSFKSLLLIAITATISIIVMQNKEGISIQVLWKSYEVSKLILFSGFFIVGLIVGLLIRFGSSSKENQATSENGLSKEDQDFLSE